MDAENKSTNFTGNPEVIMTSSKESFGLRISFGTVKKNEPITYGLPAIKIEKSIYTAGKDIAKGLPRDEVLTILKKTPFIKENRAN